MQHKKILLGTLLAVLVLGGAYAYNNGSSLQGKFEPIKLKPDLTVSSISNVGDVLTIIVKNSGPGKVAAGTAGQTYVYIDDLTVPNKTYDWNLLSDKAFFAAGGSSTLEYGSLEDGDYEVMVCVDATSIVTESKESNNCLTETVTFEPPLPDLVPDLSVTSYSVSGEVGIDETGTVVDLDIVIDLQCGIENIGTATASGTSYYLCRFLLDPSYTLGHVLVGENLSLAPGSTATYTKTIMSKSISSIDFLQEIYDTGTYTLTVQHEADYASTYFIEESDETNNSETQTFDLDASGITWVVR